MYRLAENAVIRLEDGARIPAVEGTADYQGYLDWLALGNTPLPAEEDGWRAPLMTELRARRDALLGVMTSIQSDVSASGDQVTAQAITVVKQAFRDIPANPAILQAENEHAFREAAKAAYRAVAPLVPAPVAVSVGAAMKDYVK